MSERPDTVPEVRAHIPDLPPVLPPRRRPVVQAPLTVGVIIALWVFGAATGSLLRGPDPAVAFAIGAGLDPLAAGHWWGLATSALWCQGIDSYVLSSLLVAVLLPVAERRLGSLRTAGVALAIQVVGSAAGLALTWFVAQVATGRWADQLAASIAVGPGAAVCGTLLAVSAGLSALWRRRLRLVLIVALVMLALYSGLIGDLVRLCAGLIGLAAGPLLFRRRHPRTPSRSTRAETRVLVALLVAASAIGPLVAAWAQTRVGPLSGLRFLFASTAPDVATVQQVCGEEHAVRLCAELQARLRFSGLGPALLSILPVALLLVGAEGLRRGRRAAWRGVLGLNLGLAVLGLVLAGIPVQQRLALGAGVHLHAFLLLALPLLQPLVVVLLLLATRRSFDVRAPVGTYTGLVRYAAVTAAVALGGYVGLGLLLRHGFTPVPGPLDLLADFPLRIVPPGYLLGVPPVFLAESPLATVLYEWVGALFWLVLVAGALRTFAHSRLRSAEPDLERVHELVAEGGGTLAYLTTWRGHTYWFSPDGFSAVAYRVIGGVAVTTGGPVGPPAAAPAAVAGFVAHCREQGWIPCLYSVGDEIAETARGLGWSTVQVAEETLLPLPGLAFTGRKWQDVRTALNKAAKEGIRAEWTTYSAAPLAITEQIREISEEWVADKGLPEMGFTLGGLDELADDRVRLLLAVDEDGLVHGVTSWLPIQRDGAVVGWTLDFMRRRTGDDTFRGVMEFLIASAALTAKAEGAEVLSLSGAPLARLDRGEPVAGLEKMLDGIGRRLEPVYGFRSLLAFKAKFQPVHQPLYLVYPDAATLPAIANAIGRAYLPQLRAIQAAALARAVLRDHTHALARR